MKSFRKFCEGTHLSNQEAVKYIRDFADELKHLIDGTVNRFEYRMVKNVSYTGDKADALTDKFADTIKEAVRDFQNLMNREIG